MCANPSHGGPKLKPSVRAVWLHSGGRPDQDSEGVLFMWSQLYCRLRPLRDHQYQPSKKGGGLGWSAYYGPPAGRVRMGRRTEEKALAFYHRADQPMWRREAVLGCTSSPVKGLGIGALLRSFFSLWIGEAPLCAYMNVVFDKHGLGRGCGGVQRAHHPEPIMRNYHGVCLS